MSDKKTICRKCKTILEDVEIATPFPMCEDCIRFTEQMLDRIYVAQACAIAKKERRKSTEFSRLIVELKKQLGYRTANRRKGK